MNRKLPKLVAFMPQCRTVGVGQNETLAQGGLPFQGVLEYMIYWVRSNNKAFQKWVACSTF